MKTKNVKVRIKDIKQGVTIYSSHPVFGIEELFVTGSLYIENTGTLFFPCLSRHGDNIYESTQSVCDAGINKGESRNFRRTFFKRKHAEDWAARMATDPAFISSHQRHLALCESFFSKKKWV